MRPVKNNILWTILLLNLLAIGAFLAYVGFNPVEFRAIAPRMGEVLAAEAAGKIEAVAQVRPTPAASETPAGEEPRRPPARRPPARTGDSELEGEGVKVVTARYIGPLSHPLEEEPPPMALYPFGVERRTYPSPSEIEVLIRMRNLSGFYWEKATVVFRSADPAIVPQVFEVEDWSLDGYARFAYRFPREQLEARMKMLRVRAIYGEKADTYQSRALHQERLALLERMGDDPEAQQRFYDAIGVTDGMEGTEAGRRSAEFMLTIPDRVRIADIPRPTVSADSDDRRAALALYNDFRTHAEGLEAELYRFIDIINTQGPATLAEGAGAEQLEAIRAQKEAFDKLGLDLLLSVSRSQDQQVRTLRAASESVSSSLILLLDAATKQIRYLDPTFSFEAKRAP
jgi:hypothetical protein